MRVILYPRVSSKEQLKGESIQAQERRLRNFCQEKGYEIVDVWTDGGKSATFKDDKKIIRVKDNFIIGKFDLRQRPAFQKIIEKAGNGLFDAVIFFKWDRAFRDVIFAKLSQQYLKERGIELIPSDDSTDPLTSSIMQVLSEEEIRKMKERVRISRLERFHRGQMTGRAPVGYKFNPTKKVMEVDKKKARIVQEAFKMTLEGKYYGDICKVLKLKPQSYYNIIRNKVYMGIVRFENEEKVGVHEVLVSKEDWERVNSGV